MGHGHKTVRFHLPDWVLEEENVCLRNVATDAYKAKHHADEQGADVEPNCHDVYHAAEKALEKLENEKLSISVRTHQGVRAARKFWEAKVCGRAKRVARGRR